MKYIAIMMTVLLLGCSSLGAGLAGKVLGGGDAPSLDAEVTVGKKQEEVNVDVGKKVSNEQQAQTIYNNTEEFDPILLTILICFTVAGWVLPTPQSMYRSWRGGRG